MLEEEKQRREYYGEEEDEDGEYVDGADEALYDDDEQDSGDDDGDDVYEDAIPTVVMTNPHEEPVKNHTRENEVYENDANGTPKGKSRNGTGKKATAEVHGNNVDAEKESMDTQPQQQEDNVSSFRKFFGWRGKKNQRSASPETKSSVADGSVSHTPSVKGRTYHEVLV